MPESSLPVEFLFTLKGELGGRTVIRGGPQGTRVVFDVTGGSFEGPRLRGTLASGPGGDWVTARTDGSFRLDVRILLKTDDGADVLMTYNGLGVSGENGGSSLRTAPQFETGDERYAWLNRVQAVGLGRGEGDVVSYEVYALR